MQDKGIDEYDPMGPLGPEVAGDGIDIGEGTQEPDLFPGAVRSPRDLRNWGVGLVDPARLHPAAAAGDTATPIEVRRKLSAATISALGRTLRRLGTTLDGDGLHRVAKGVLEGREVAIASWTSSRKPSRKEIEAGAEELADATIDLMDLFDAYPTQADVAAFNPGGRSMREFVRSALAELRLDAVEAIVEDLKAVRDPRARHLFASWLHVRACLGDRNAMAQFAKLIGEFRLTPSRTRQDDHGKVLESAWLRLVGATHRWDQPMATRACEIIAEHGFDILKGTEDYLSRYSVQLPAVESYAAKSTELGTAAEGTVSDPGSMRVLPGIGDPQSAEGRSAARRFASLLSPLPLRGGAVPDEVWRALQAEFPWMGEANREIAESVAVSARRGGNAYLCRPILLHGKPGVGKSRYARRVAELCGVPFSMLSLSGATTSVVLKGTERGWASARASHMAITFQTEGVANPLILADEVDKTGGGSRNGDPLSVMLTLLEAETARNYQDDYLLAPLDCSAVNWMLTANDISGLSQAFLSRVTLIRSGHPEARHFPGIYDGVLADVARDLRLPPELMPDISARRGGLEKSFGIDLSMRLLKQAVTREVRRAIWQPDGPRLVEPAPGDGPVTA